MDWLDIKEFFKDTIKYILFVVVVFVIALYVIGLQQIVGESMEPTHKNGDVLIINKLSNNYKRGDIITFLYGDIKYLVKRVIGLPGEYVEIKDNKIYINGEVIEDYVEVTDMKDFDLKNLGHDKIPEDMYFVMGDNRGNSLDSRDYRVGLIKKEDIVGITIFRLFPFNKIGTVK